METVVMKSSRRLPLTIVVVLLVIGIGVVLLLRHVQPKPSEVSLVTVKEPVLATNLEPSASVEITNPPSISAARKPTAEDRRLTALQLMKETVNLSDEQAKRLEPILQQQQKQLAAFRRETSLSRQQRLAKLKEMRAANDAQLKSVLTPEQFEKWRKRGFELQQALQQQASSPP